MGGTGGTQSVGVTNPGAVTTQQKPMLLVFGLDGQAEIPKPGVPARTKRGRSSLKGVGE